jgi:SRSO17 transposase
MGTMQADVVSGSVTGKDLAALLPELEAFHARFGRFFCRSEGRRWGQRYLAGLLLPIARKNVENVAEQVGAPPRKLQQLISDSPWDDAGCVVELQRLVGEELGAPDGVVVIDDTGFAKKGTRSAGVGRQYSGTLGRRDNCQVGVFLGYASRHGHTLVDRRLYLLEDWFAAGAAERRRRAGVPEQLGFATKPELAAELLGAADAAGVLPFGWVTADAAYGDCHDLRQVVADLGRWYVVEVSSTAEVYDRDPAWQVPARRPGRGRPPSRPRPTPSSAPALLVREVVAGLAASAWVRHRVTEGAKGPREYEFARVRMVEKRHRAPGPAGWLLARRPVGGGEVKYYLSNAPATVALAELAWVGCLRWTVEEDFELAKGEVGLDDYEVTKLRGWYHHVTLALLALAFVKFVQRKWERPAGPRERPGDPGVAAGRAATGPLESGGGDRLVGPPAAA